MTDLKSLCDKVLNDAEKATKRPWHILERSTQDSGTTIGFVTEIDGPKTFYSYIEEKDALYITTSANSAERLVKAVMVLTSVLEAVAENDEYDVYFHKEASAALIEANMICRGDK